MAAYGSVIFAGLAEGLKKAVQGDTPVVGDFRVYSGINETLGINYGGLGYRPGDTYSVFFGAYAGAAATTNVLTANTCIGRAAGFGTKTSFNTCVGFGAGVESGTSGAGGNTFLGYNSGLGLANAADTLGLSTFSFTHLLSDANKFSTTRPIQPPTYTVAALPSAVTSGLGSNTYTSNGRKAGEAAGAGTGCPVWSNGSIWLTFYGNTAVVA